MPKGKNPNRGMRKKLYEKLIHELYHSSWSIGESTMTHKKSDLKLWIKNGLFFIDTHPVGSGFSIWEKINLYIAVKNAIACAHLQKISNSE